MWELWDNPRAATGPQESVFFTQRDTDMTANLTRRRFLKGLGAGAAALAAGRLAGAPAAKNRKPNVVIIFTDDQGTLDANCYGSKDLYTPTMDALAATGVRFTQAYSHTVCCPARAMLMNGRQPQRSNVNHWTQGDAHAKGGRNMFLDEVTIAEMLKRTGYRTGLFGKWHLGADLAHGPLEQGFDEFFGHRGGFIDNYNHHFLHGMGFHDLYENKTEVFRKGRYFPDMTTAGAVRFVQANKARPFFLYLAFNIPHYPEQPDRKFDKRYEALPMPRRSYARMISTVDDRMGMVVKTLEDLGLRDNTIIIFQSDNGASTETSHIRFDNHKSGLPKGHNYGANGGGGNMGKWRGAKGSFFEGGIRVPAIISFPRKLPKGVVRDQAVTAMDWFPTILDLCGITRPMHPLDGHSLLEVIASPDAASPYKVMHWAWGDRWLVRQGDWKLIGRGRARPGKKPRAQLFNLTRDTPERQDLARKHPEIVERLYTLHENWVREMEADVKARVAKGTAK